MLTILTIMRYEDNSPAISIENVSEELDDHFKNFGKYASDVNYNLFGYCNFCNTRIDEFGYCACIGGTPDWYLHSKLSRLMKNFLFLFSNGWKTLLLEIIEWFTIN